MTGPGSSAASRALAVLALACLGMVAAPAAGATPLFVWHGTGPFNWSEGSNWQGGHAPAATAGTVNLEFPLSDCQSAPRACDATTEDLAGLTLGTLTLDGITVRFPAFGSHETPPAEPAPAAYTVAGTKPLKLAGGIDADIAEEGSGAGVEAATVAVAAPLELTAANVWTVGPGDGGILQIAGPVTGRHPLDVQLRGANSLELPGEVETGPILVAGRPGSTARLSIGQGSQINATNREPVRLQDVSLYGSGDLGPLTLDGGELRVGEDAPGGDLHINGGLTLEGSATLAAVMPAADHDRAYSAIVHGRAELGSATLALTEGCPVAGDSYTLLEAEDGLSGRLTSTAGQTIEDGQTLGGEPGGCGAGAPGDPLRLEYGLHSVTLTALAYPSGSSGPPPAAPSPPAYDAAARAMLAADLRWLGAGRRIRSILAGRGENVALTAPRPGIFSIQWRVRSAGRSVLVAAGRLTLPTGGTGQLRILLTPAGRRVLRRARRLHVTVLQAFASAGLPTDLTQTTLLLRR